MKKIILFLPFFLLIFTSCAEKNQTCDIYDFTENYNKSVGYEYICENDFISSENNILYLFKDEICISFYVNKKTGNIEKCNVVFTDSDYNKTLIQNTENALINNNKYFKKSEYKSGGFCMISFEDSRYIKENTSPTLKKDIKQEDLY